MSRMVYMEGGVNLWKYPRISPDSTTSAWSNRYWFGLLGLAFCTEMTADRLANGTPFDYDKFGAWFGRIHPGLFEQPTLELLMPCPQQV